MMRHPIDGSQFIVELSSAKSMYSHEQKLGGNFTFSPAVERMLTGRGAYGFSNGSWSRISAELRVSDDGKITVLKDHDKLSERPYVGPSLDEAVMTYERIEGLGIVNPQTTSVMEFCILADTTIRVFQYTPVMQKHKVNGTTIPKKYSSIGTQFIGAPTGHDGITLPVVRFPGKASMEVYLRTGRDSEVENIPALAEMLDEKRSGGIHLLFGPEPEMAGEMLTKMATLYIQYEQERCGNDYLLAVANMDRLLGDIVFSIPTPTAMVVRDYGTGLLQHGIARWLYEVPLLFVGGS